MTHYRSPRPRAPGHQLPGAARHRHAERCPRSSAAQQPFDDGPTFVPVERYTSPSSSSSNGPRCGTGRGRWRAARSTSPTSATTSSTTSPAARTSWCAATRARSRRSTTSACTAGACCATEGGCRATEFRCPFHGFGWNIDGSLKNIPCAWDFPQVDDPAEWSLRERAGRHVGWVRVHQPRSRRRRRWSRTSASLDDHFARWPLEDRFVQVHVAKVLRCNWKVAQEAFMEAMHVVATHPQILPSIGDANSQYDVFGNFSRAITPNGTPSPHLNWQPTRAGDARLDVRPQPRRAAGADRARGPHRP